MTYEQKLLDEIRALRDALDKRENVRKLHAHLNKIDGIVLRHCNKDVLIKESDIRGNDLNNDDQTSVDEMTAADIVASIEGM